MYVGIHIKSHFRPILDKIKLCRQSAVEIINVRLFKIVRGIRPFPRRRTGRRTDMTKQSLAKTPKNERRNQDTGNFEF